MSLPHVSRGTCKEPRSICVHHAPFYPRERPNTNPAQTSTTGDFLSLRIEPHSRLHRTTHQSPSCHGEPARNALPHDIPSRVLRSKPNLGTVHSRRSLRQPASPSRHPATVACICKALHASATREPSCTPATFSSVLVKKAFVPPAFVITPAKGHM